jgi:hypothetical protein
LTSAENSCYTATHIKISTGNDRDRQRGLTMQRERRTMLQAPTSNPQCDTLEPIGERVSLLVGWLVGLSFLSIQRTNKQSNQLF